MELKLLLLREGELGQRGGGLGAPVGERGAHEVGLGAAVEEQFMDAEQLAAVLLIIDIAFDGGKGWTEFEWLGYDVVHRWSTSLLGDTQGYNPPIGGKPTKT